MTQVVIGGGNRSRCTYSTTSAVPSRADGPWRLWSGSVWGAPAAYFASPRRLDELVATSETMPREGYPFKILAGGSNVLVRDEGVNALVIHLESPFFSDVTVTGQHRWKPARPFR